MFLTAEAVEYILVPFYATGSSLADSSKGPSRKSSGPAAWHWSGTAKYRDPGVVTPSYSGLRHGGPSFAVLLRTLPSLNTDPRKIVERGCGIERTEMPRRGSRSGCARSGA